MEQKTIVEQAHQMSSKEDLLNLLNRIKQDEMVANGLGDKFHPFTMELLHYYCNLLVSAKNGNHIKILPRCQ